MTPLENYNAKSGKLIPVWHLAINTRPDDAERLLDAIMTVHPLVIGQYERNATVTGLGAETGRPNEKSVTRIHNADFAAGETEIYPSVELKVSFERDPDVLERIMDAILDAHQYEEPVIHLTEAWSSRAFYNPGNANPNRWWNDGRGTPGMVTLDPRATQAD